MSAEQQSLDGLEDEAQRALAEASTPAAVADLRARFLGKKSALSAVLRGIGRLEPDERARIGERANVVKERIEALVNARRDELGRGERARALA
jgi:phenylalanyl-tRNA synthetase alpha chain